MNHTELNEKLKKLNIEPINERLSIEEYCRSQKAKKQLYIEYVDLCKRLDVMNLIICHMDDVLLIAELATEKMEKVVTDLGDKDYAFAEFNNSKARRNLINIGHELHGLIDHHFSLISNCGRLWQNTELNNYTAAIWNYKGGSQLDKKTISSLLHDYDDAQDNLGEFLQIYSSKASNVMLAKDLLLNTYLSTGLPPIDAKYIDHAYNANSFRSAKFRKSFVKELQNARENLYVESKDHEPERTK